MQLKASPEGLTKIKEARANWTDEQWCIEASKIIEPSKDWGANDQRSDTDYEGIITLADGYSISTLKKFLWGKPINNRVFQIFCQVIGLDWQEVVDISSNEQLQERDNIARSVEDFWVGRNKLIAKLRDKLLEDCRVLVLTGMTGIGKTALGYQLAKLLEKTDRGVKPLNLENELLPPKKAYTLNSLFERVKPLNFEDEEFNSFVSVAVDLLIRWGEIVTPDVRQQPEQLLECLLLKLRDNRYLVQMDSVERLLKGDEATGWNNFQDEWWGKFFRRLLVLSDCQSRLILTSQDFPTEFQEFGEVKYWHIEPLIGLEPLEQLALFQLADIEIEAKATSPNLVYLKRIGSAYEGHPLALRLIAWEIRSEPFYNDVAAYWNAYGREIEKIKKELQQEKVELDVCKLKLPRLRLQEFVKQKIEKSLERLKNDFLYAYELLCVGACFNRPFPKEEWFSVLKKFRDYDNNQLLRAIDTLKDRYLVEIEEFIEKQELIRLHNLIRSVAIACAKKELI